MNFKKYNNYYKCIKYYLNNVNSEKYTEYKNRVEQEERKSHNEYIRKQRPDLLVKTDCYEDDENVVITDVIITDVLSNKGIEKLLKRLYALNKRKYKVKSYYKKPGVFNHYDYVHIQYSGSSAGVFAEVIFLEDKYIDKIEISWSQINNMFAYLEYKYIFRRPLNQEGYNRFMLDNIESIDPRKDYYEWYIIDDDSFNQYMSLDQMDNDFFTLILQHFITSELHSEQGKYRRLPNITQFTRPKEVNIEKLYLTDFGVSFYNKNENYIITSDYRGTDFYLYAGNNLRPSFWTPGYISKYGDTFYNLFFGVEDLKYVEYRFSRFLNNRKNVFYNKDFLYLQNKQQSILTSKEEKNKSIIDDFKDKWDLYIDNKKIDFYDFYNRRNINYKEIYNNLFSYLKIRSEMNYTRNGFIVSCISAAVALAAIISSVL